MFDENKMYAVIGVLLIILMGLFIYLISIDFKLRKLEKKCRDTSVSDEASNTKEQNL